MLPRHTKHNRNIEPETLAQMRAGWSRQAVSPVLDEAGQAARTGIGACSAANQNAGCAAQFIASFGERALRRPLAAEEAARYHELFADYEASGFASAIHLVLQTMPQSPNFIYHTRLSSRASLSRPRAPRLRLRPSTVPP